jgi:serine protease Do
MGNPFGLNNSLTLGVVSATRRWLPRSPVMSHGLAGLGAQYGQLIQTDAAINPGNSGGPLVNIDGEVIGINVLIFTRTRGAQGVGFAIPAETIRHHLPALRAGQTVEYGWLGVGLRDLTGDLARTFGVRPYSGVLINEVLEGDPAHRAGLRPGMVITRFGDHPIRSYDELTYRVGLGKVGSEVGVEVIELDGKKAVHKVTLGSRFKNPAEEEAIAGAPEKPARPAPEGYWRGISVRGLSAPERLRGGKGVVIARVLADSLAERAGLRKNMRIEQIGASSREMKDIAGLDGFGKLTAKLAGPSLLRIRHHGYVALPAE